MIPEPIQQALDARDLPRVLERTISHFHADSGSIHLLGADGVLHLKAAHGLPQHVLDLVRVIPVGKGMAGLAVERAEPVTACNIQTDSSGAVNPGARKTGMEGALVVPVMDHEKAIGAFGIANREERTFTLLETALLLKIARQTRD